MSMVQIYVRLILEGRRTLETIPETIREQVAEALNEGAE